MSVLEETKSLPAPKAIVPANRQSLAQRFLRFASSVRLGVTLLILLVIASMIGMVVMQQNIPGFDNYFAALTPAQKYLYGKLGFFDIYHAWYFNALICALSTNIVLSTIDRFPKIWPFFSRPSVTVPLRWLREQKQTAEFSTAKDPEFAIDTISSAMKNAGFRNPKLSEKNGRTFIFAESGRWNRLGFVAVHIGLLTIFFGGFLTAQLSNIGNLPLSPGQSSNIILDSAFALDKVKEVQKQLPFEVTFTDMQQKLIRKEGSLAANNTIDWLTWFTIKDEYGVHEGYVQMNRPFDYRGYRFFQASFVPVGRARNITLEATPVGGGSAEKITIPRDGSGILADGTKIVFSNFRGNFRMGPDDMNEDTSTYPNPAAILEVVPPGGIIETATAFPPEVGNIPIANKPVGGYTFKLLDFEKVAEQHVLSVQHDPGSSVVYVGFTLLCLTLVAVFMFSHKRVWAVVEEQPGKGVEILLAGNTNRNPNGFDEKFEQLRQAVANELKEEGQNG